MPERFSEDDARRIFARAAERQHADEQRPAGLSLAELQEIGQAAGLDPAHVAAAVAEVGGGEGRETAPPATFLGVDVEPRASRVIPGEVTDEVWGQFVSRVRPTFKTIGVTSDVGATREWQGTNERGGLSNLRMTAAPAEGGTLVRLETSKAGQAREYRIAAAIFAAMTAFFALLGTLSGDGGDAGFWVFVAGFALFTLAIPLAGWLSQRRWAERRRRQFDALLDQFELIARDAAPPKLAPPTTAEAGGAGEERAEVRMVDFDLGEEAEPPTGAPTRRRTRS